MRKAALAAAAAVMLAGPSSAAAQTVTIDSAAVAVCPAVQPAGSLGDASKQSPSPLPDFTAPDCKTVPAHAIDPQGRMIWVKASLPVPPEFLDLHTPLGLFVLAKAASEIYLNGEWIGRNGVPGATREEEVVGRMDAVVSVPRALLRRGDNELVLRMSSHHGLLRLAAPVHALMLGPYGAPQQRALGYRWPALIAFGALLAGACYFAAISAGGEGRRSSLLLALMSMLAAGQLFAETARALYAYPYPVHDLRLIAILAAALLFGQCLSAYVIWTFMERRRVALFTATAAATAAAVLSVPGFDSMTLLAVMVPTLAAVVLTAFASWKRIPHAAAHLLALLVFAALMITAPLQFLDLLFYYSVAAFLLFLFAQQAFALADERRLRRLEAERASRLELVLEQTRAAAEPATINVTSTGRIERIPVDQIVSCTAAGDYVELRLADGREVLHDASMNELEKTLPATFLRVHRSHMVNSAYVRTLKRLASGVGRLLLADGSEIPVSRRVMPKVRSALD